MKYFLFQVSSNAVFELELENFVNRFGKDDKGHCCSGFKNKNGKCSDTCLTKFRICLKVYQEVIDPKAPCTFGERITPVLGTNEVNFSKVSIKDFINPLEFKLDSWQVRMINFVFDIKSLTFANKCQYVMSLISQFPF